jgi:hypothetical protein
MHTDIHASSGIRTKTPTFERAKTVRALDRAAILIGRLFIPQLLNAKYVLLFLLLLVLYYYYYYYSVYRCLPFRLLSRWLNVRIGLQKYFAGCFILKWIVVSCFEERIYRKHSGKYDPLRSPCRLETDERNGDALYNGLGRRKQYEQNISLESLWRM